MAFGILMLILASLCTYFYIESRKNPDRSRIDTHPTMEGLSARLKNSITSENSPTAAPRNEPEISIEAFLKLQTGDYLQMKDVGLKMLHIDGKIKSRHLVKSGSERITQFVVDSGVEEYMVQASGYGNHEGVYVLTAQPQSTDLSLSAADFHNLNHTPPESLTYQGTEYRIAHKSSQTFCPQENELSSEPQLEWWYTEGTGESHLAILRKGDQRLQIYFMVSVPLSQCEWTRLHSS